MSTISLCMIVKDEEKVIERCLNTVVDIVDEIIIVDTGSQDSTKEKVKKYKADIYDFPWKDDFAEARNFAFSKARMDYILWLDADDVLEKEDQEKLKLLKESLNNTVDVISMMYVLSTDENINYQLFSRANDLINKNKDIIDMDSNDLLDLIEESDVGIVNNDEMKCECIQCGAEDYVDNWVKKYNENISNLKEICPICGGEMIFDVKTHKYICDSEKCLE